MRKPWLSRVDGSINLDSQQASQAMSVGLHLHLSRVGLILHKICRLQSFTSHQSPDCSPAVQHVTVFKGRWPTLETMPSVMLMFSPPLLDGQVHANCLVTKLRRVPTGKPQTRTRSLRWHRSSLSERGSTPSQKPGASSTSSSSARSQSEQNRGEAAFSHMT